MDLFKCNLCNNVFKSKYNLENHKKRAKYCKKNMLETCDFCDQNYINMEQHKEICYEYLKNDILKLKNINIQISNELEIYKSNSSKLEQQIKDLQDQLKDITLKLIDKPTNINNYSNNSKNTNNTKIDIFNTLTPLKDSDFVESASKLTLEHVRNGVEGYAKFSIENPLKDKLICIDYPRKKISYKDENDNKIEEYKFEKILPKIFLGIKDVNKELLEIVMDEIDTKYNNYSNTIEEYEEGSKEEKDYSDLLDTHYNKMMEYTNIMCDCRSISNGKLNNKLAKELTDIILQNIPRKI